MQNEEQKFYDTYGKKTSFVSEEPAAKENKINPSPSSISSLKKYATIAALIIAVIGFAILGSVFLLVVLSFAAIHMIVRTTFSKT